MVTWTTIGERWPSEHDFKGESNPFQRDEAGSIKSPAAISRLIRENETKARAMCKLAGEPTAIWFGEQPR